jgi:hypothetical protein
MSGSLCIHMLMTSCVKVSLCVQAYDSENFMQLTSACCMLCRPCRGVYLGKLGEAMSGSLCIHMPHVHEGLTCV